MLTFLLAIYVFVFANDKYLKMKHNKVKRTLYIEENINKAMLLLDMQIDNSKEGCVNILWRRVNNNLDKDYQVITDILKPAINKLVKYHKSQMLDKSIANNIIKTLYTSTILETSYLLCDGRFEFYNIKDFAEIKTLSSEQQCKLQAAKDLFLQKHFPDFYDIVCKVRKENKQDFF
jgi:hypothetical protein